MKSIPLTRGYVALVDDEDYERVAALRWYANVHHRNGRVLVYACRHQPIGPKKRTTLKMHCFIMGRRYIDHADDNGLNNQRNNLRPANHSQNGANRRKTPGCASVWKGVHRTCQSKTWIACIKKNGVDHKKSGFRQEVNAAQAYNFLAEELFGQFAKFNLPIQKP